MTFILVIVSWLGTSTTVPNFISRDDCEVAMRDVTELNTWWTPNTKAVCLVQHQ